MAEWGKLSKHEQRLQIAQHTEEFLAKGYQITRLPMDCSVLEGRSDESISTTRDFNYKLNIELDGDQAYELVDRLIELVDLLNDVKHLLEQERLVRDQKPSKPRKAKV